MEWISVDERLPDSLKPVFIWCDGYPSTAMLKGFYEIGNGPIKDFRQWVHVDSRLPLVCMITHWAEIVEPPASVEWFMKVAYVDRQNTMIVKMEYVTATNQAAAAEIVKSQYRKMAEDGGFNGEFLISFPVATHFNHSP
jgi:hypothetical protein